MSDCRFGVSPVNYPDPDPDPIDVSVLVWSNSSHWFKRSCSHKLFLSKFEFQSASVTLKMRSRSPKSNHFFPPSQ